MYLYCDVCGKEFKYRKGTLVDGWSQHHSNHYIFDNKKAFLTEFESLVKDIQYKIRKENKQMEDKFIVVSNPYVNIDGDFNTKRRTYTKEQAIKVAQSLASQYPGKKFYVAELVGCAAVANAVYSEL